MSITANVERAKADLDAAYAAGKQAEYDAFWDGFQDYGRRTEYYYAFRYWSAAEEIKPKYPIRTTAIYQTFQYCEKLKKLPNVQYVGDGFDGMYAAFHRCYLIEEIPFDIKMANVTDMGAFNSTFYDCKKLKTIKKIILDGQPYRFGYTFAWCDNLENLTIEGEITSSGFDVSFSPKLSKASITSIMSALSTTTSGLTVTLSKRAVDNAFTSAEWAALIATRSNWTIALA